MSLAEVRSDTLRQIRSGNPEALPTAELFDAVLRLEVGDVLDKPTTMQLMAFHKALGAVEGTSSAMRAKVATLQGVIRNVLNSTPYGLTRLVAADVAAAAATYGLLPE